MVTLSPRSGPFASKGVCEVRRALHPTNGPGGVKVSCARLCVLGGLLMLTIVLLMCNIYAVLSLTSTTKMKEIALQEWHNQSDRSADEKDKLMQPSTPKLAFMYLMVGSHKREKLWLDFFADADPNLYVIRVHPHPHHLYKVRTPLFHDNVIPDLVETKWSTPSLVAATRNLIAASLQDENVTMMALISDSCIPLRSFNETYDNLVRKNMVSRFTLHAGQNDNNAGYKDVWGASPELALHMETSVFYEARSLPEGFLLKHSQFFAISRRHAEIVLRHYDRHYEKFWRDADVPDESMILSILAAEVTEEDSRMMSRNTNNNYNKYNQSNNGIEFSRLAELPQSAAIAMRLPRSHTNYVWYDKSITCELREMWKPHPEMLDDTDIEYFRQNTECIFLRKSADGYKKKSAGQ